MYVTFLGFIETNRVLGEWDTVTDEDEEEKRERK